MYGRAYMYIYGNKCFQIKYRDKVVRQAERVTFSFVIENIADMGDTFRNDITIGAAVIGGIFKHFCRYLENKRLFHDDEL